MQAFDTVQLSTPRLRLRPLTPSDAQDLFAIFSDPLVVRYWSRQPWTSIDEAHALIADDLPALAEGEHLRLALQRGDDGRIVGTCSLFQFAPQCRRAEIGYAMASAFWGQGLMHEALTALLRFAFGTLDLNRIEADVDPRNLPSVRSLERLGFVREGLLRERWIVADEVSDTSFYGLLRREWLAGADAGRTA